MNMIQIKVLKPTKFFPVVGKTHEVEPSPRVRVLIHNGYIVKVEDVGVPVVEIRAETAVVDTTAEAQAAFEYVEQDEDDAPGEDIDVLEDPEDEDN